MKICYEIKGNYNLGTDRCYILKYVVVDPAHSSGPPTDEIKRKFFKGDIINIAFPIVNPGSPIFDNVTALVTNKPHGNNIPYRGWMITVNYDSPGVDFGEGYRVLFEAKFDNIEMNVFEIGFLYNGQGEPGKQPWGFTAASAPGQHTETGETSPCNLISPKPPLNLRIQ